MAGTSGKQLSQKLGIKPGFRIFADSPPKPYADIVGELPDGARILSRASASLDMVHLFATQSSGLAGKLQRHRAAIAPDGMIWVSWPKAAGLMSQYQTYMHNELQIMVAKANPRQITGVDD